MHVSFDAAAFVASWQSMQERMNNAGSYAWARCLRTAYEVQKGYGYKDQTGRLTQSMSWRSWEPSKFGYRGELKTSAKYALFVDMGTAPHKIPKRGGPSKFFWPKIGRWVTFSVAHPANHPGFKGAKFTAAAIQTFGQSVGLDVERALSAAASKA